MAGDSPKGHTLWQHTEGLYTRSECCRLLLWRGKDEKQQKLQNFELLLLLRGAFRNNFSA